MAKKVLIISTSLRGGSNSDILANECAKGAKEAGHIIWNEPYSGDYNVVMRHICNIREKIEDDPGHPVYIQTVRGVGYRFNGNLGSE